MTSKSKVAWEPAFIGIDLSNAEATTVLALCKQAFALQSARLPKVPSAAFALRNSPLQKVIDRIELRLHPGAVDVCATCGNPYVQMESWVEINSGADGGGEPPGGTWCGECSENDIETGRRYAGSVQGLQQAQAR